MPILIDTAEFRPQPDLAVLLHLQQCPYCRAILAEASRLLAEHCRQTGGARVVNP